MSFRAVAIFGPTGVGKTSLAIELACGIGEIISVDSMQVYKNMDIGTAKPSKSDLKKVKHHLIDILNPNEQFTAGLFIEKSTTLIREINSRGKIPFLVGGTGLYFSSLIKGIADIPKIPLEVKKSILKKHERAGQQRFYKILKRLDPKYAEKISVNDKQRTMRALEVLSFTKKKFSDFHKPLAYKSGINFIKVGIKVERSALYELINKRVDFMLESGLVEEVKKLLNEGYKSSDPGLKAIGYKEIISYLENETTFEKAVTDIKKNSRHYAKRQFTWFNALPDAAWFDASEREKIKEYIKSSLGDLY